MVLEKAGFLHSPPAYYKSMYIVFFGHTAPQAQQLVIYHLSPKVDMSLMGCVGPNVSDRINIILEGHYYP
jgi:hypothetical protein